MKVKLVISNKDEFVGYKNVPYDDLSQVYDNSCFELYCDSGVIKKIPNIEFETFFNKCCSKLRHGGQIIVTGPDIANIAMCYTRRSLDEAQLASMLQNSLGFYNCKIIEKAMKNNNLKIHSMVITQNHFIVRGIRE